MTAAVMAVATLATSMVPFSADAFSVDKNSKFTYDLKVEGTADNLIKVTFYTTCNPGVSGLSVAVRYDQDNLEFVKKSMDPDYDYITAKKLLIILTMGLLLQRLLPIQGLIMRVRFIFLTTLE